MFGDVNFVLVAFHCHGELSLNGKSVGSDLSYALLKFLDLLCRLQEKVVFLGRVKLGEEFLGVFEPERTFLDVLFCLKNLLLQLLNPFGKNTQNACRFNVKESGFYLGLCEKLGVGVEFCAYLV